MGKLLLITGDLATGKSTFAHMLSKRYGTSMLFKDAVKEVLGDTIGFSNREENRNLSIAAVALMCHVFSGFGELNKNLILEANFRTSELERLHQIASENHYDVLTLVVRGDIEILHKRYLNRIHNENRHPVHISVSWDHFDAFRAYIEELRNEKIPGNAIQVNADDFSYQTEAELLEKIDEFMKE